MNVAQKAELKRIFNSLEEAKSELETMHQSLEEVLEDKSDKWRESEAGEQAQAELDNIQESMDSIESACDKLQEYTS